jgi:agmatinase
MTSATQMPADSLTLPRFCGLASFMRIPTSETAEGADVAIVGLPSDSGGPYRTGARFGPSAVRGQSVMLRQVNPYRGNLNLFETLKIVDVGDSPVVPGYLEHSMTHMEKTIDAIVGAGAIPLAIGGDHSVSLPELRALASRHGPLALVHWDAHSDTWDNYFDGLKYSAGTPFRRAAEEGLIEPADSIQMGMRGSLFRDTDISQSIDLGFEVLTTDDCMEIGPDALAERIRARVKGRPAFLTFDMDFVDPASAPGVQTPEAGGPSARETLNFVRALSGLSVVGADIVETNPLYDGPGQITALLAATVASEFLGLIAAERIAGR